MTDGERRLRAEWNPHPRGPQTYSLTRAEVTTRNTQGLALALGVHLPHLYSEGQDHISLKTSMIVVTSWFAGKISGILRINI